MRSVRLEQALLIAGACLFSLPAATQETTPELLAAAAKEGKVAVLSTSMLLITFALIAIIYRFTDRRPV